MKKTLLILGLAFFAIQLNGQTISASDVILYLDFEDDFVDGAGGFTFSKVEDTKASVTYNTGKFGKSATFDTATGTAYKSTSTGGVFNHVVSHTMAFWINLPSLPEIVGNNMDFVFQSGGDGTDSRVIMRYGNDARIRSFSNASAVLNKKVSDNASPTVMNNTWHHIIIQLDTNAGTRKLFVDGVEQKSENVTGSAVANGIIRIGGGNNNPAINVVTGSIDDFLITSEVLSAAQITQIMTSGVQASLDGTLSISSVKNDSAVKVFVNDGILTYQSPSKVTSSEVYSITGQQLINIKNAENSKINIGQLNTGLYILRLNSEDKISTKKFVVK